MLLEAGLGLLLARYSGEESVLFGTCEAGVNPLPARLDLRWEESAGDLLAGVRRARASRRTATADARGAAARRVDPEPPDALRGRDRCGRRRAGRSRAPLGARAAGARPLGRRAPGDLRRGAARARQRRAPARAPREPARGSGARCTASGGGDPAAHGGGARPDPARVERHGGALPRDALPARAVREAGRPGPRGTGADRRRRAADLRRARGALEPPGAAPDRRSGSAPTYPWGSRSSARPRWSWASWRSPRRAAATSRSIRPTPPTGWRSWWPIRRVPVLVTQAKLLAAFAGTAAAVVAVDRDRARDRARERRAAGGGRHAAEPLLLDLHLGLDRHAQGRVAEPRGPRQQLRRLQPALRGRTRRSPAGPGLDVASTCAPTTSSARWRPARRWCSATPPGSTPASGRG